MSILVEEAIRRIKENTERLGAETLPLAACSGRYLAQELRAAISQPPFARSPLDGYAIRAADTAGAAKESPVTLRVVSKYYAGQNAALPVRAGEASRIMTGSMLPVGADCVVMQEHTDEGEERVRVFRELHTGDNYVFPGEDFQAGDRLLAEGTWMDAAAMSVAAASGQGSLCVWKRPCAAIVSTGDELTEPGAPLEPGKIYDSNLYYLKTRLAELGTDCVSSRVVGDELEAICGAIREAAERCDLVLTTGGVSVGQKDLIPAALERLGARVVFQGVRMKPGMPTTFSRLGGARVLSLSGNPFAAAVGFEVLARPCLHALSQDPNLLPRRRSCVLDTPFGKSSPAGRFLRGVCAGGHVLLPEGHSNGQMRSMIGCNCLVAVRPDSGPLRSGETVEVLML